jgi:hypothetical protein
MKTHTNSDSMQRMPKSLYGIRNRGITHMSQALDPRQERQPIHIQEESVRVPSYIGKRSNINSNNTVPRSLNGVIPSTNQEGVGGFTNQQRNRARVEDGLSRSFKDVRDTFIDRSTSQYKGMTLMDDDKYGNKNSLEANAAIQQDQELIKLSTSSFDNRNIWTNDSAPTVSNLPDKYGAGTKDSKMFVQQHNHIITPVAAAATMENETDQKQQHHNSDSKTINESMKVLMEYMTHSAMSRKLVKQFASPFTNITSDDKSPSSSLSNSTSLLLSSNNKQHVVVKAKRNSIGRCKHNKPQRMKEYRSSCRKRFDCSFDTTTRCDSPTPDATFATSAAVHPSAPSPSTSNNNFFSNQPHQHPYFPSHNNNDCDENSVLMELSLFLTIQAPEYNYSITNVDHDDNDNDNDNDKDNDNGDLSLTPTVVSQLLFMNLPVANNHNGNNVNDDDDIVSVSSTTTGTSWLWRTAEATTTTTAAAAK